MKGQYDRAVSDYDEAIRLNPKDAEAFCSRGVAYYRKGDYDRAIADCNKAVTLNPKDAGSFAIRGLAYAKKGQYDNAITDFDEAIRLKPNFTQAIKNRAEIVAKRNEQTVAKHRLLSRLQSKRSKSGYLSGWASNPARKVWVGRRRISKNRPRALLRP